MCTAADLTLNRRKLATTKGEVSALRGASEHPQGLDLPAGDKASSLARELQTCPASYTPDYPDAISSGGYDTYVASIIGTFIKDGKDNRCDSNAVGDYFIGWAAASIAAAAATEVPIGNTVAQVALNAFEVVIHQIEYQDGNIDSAEIEAGYENTVKLITATCDIRTDIADVKSTAITRFDAISTTLTNFQTLVTNRFTTLDSSIQAFSEDVTNRFNTVDISIEEFRSDVTNRIQAFRTDMSNRFSTVDTTLVNLQTYLTTRLDTVETILDSRFDSVDNTLSARFDRLDRELKIIRTLLITPEGRRTAFNDPTLICDGIRTTNGNCPTVTNFP